MKLINFANVDQVCAQVGKFDFVLADLGVSSMQIDTPDRGFSYKVDAPLDLRMNPYTGISAAELLSQIRKDDLIDLFIENADEPYAKEIALAIMGRRKKNPVKTTLGLKNAVEDALSFLPEKGRKEAVKKSCARVFQALRIDVNKEFEVLYEFLEKLPKVLAPNGRVAVLTFHSGEDRMVKQFFKQMYHDGIYSDISKEVIRPTQEECNRNPRAKSTKMRWAIRSSQNID